jgi:long-chain acyl-CoA synthetase
MNLFKNIQQHANDFGETIAVKTSETIITYKELYEKIKYSQQYLKQVVKPGKAVILKEKKQLDFTVSFLCLLSCEALVIPVSGDIKETELQEIIDITDAIVFDNQLVTYLLNNMESYNGAFNFPDEEIAGIIHMTSGSTGKAKYCIRNLKALTHEGSNYQNAYKLEKRDVVLSTCPLNHSFALGAALLTSVYVGCSLYAMDKFVPKKIIKILADSQITYVVMVSDIAKMLCLANVNRSNSEFNIRIPLVGAGQVSEDIYNQFYEKFGAKIYSNYGSTETGAIMTRTEDQPYLSVGKPMDDVSIRIKDEKGNILEDSVVEGNLYVKSKAMLKKYWNQVLDSDKDGYISVNDIVYRDKEGYFYIKGRKKMVKIGGNSVNTICIENILSNYPDITECIVYGCNDKEGRTILMAMIAGENINVSELREYCKNKLAIYEIPSVFTINKKLERNDMGKIKLKMLN